MDPNMLDYSQREIDTSAPTLKRIIDNLVHQQRNGMARTPEDSKIHWIYRKHATELEAISQILEEKIQEQCQVKDHIKKSLNQIKESRLEGQ